MISVIRLAIVFLLIFTLPAAAQEPIRAVTTTGMITDIVREVGGDLVEVEGLMGAGVDPHLYKASESDVRRLSNAQIIFYNGLHLEAKMQTIFQAMGRRIPTVAVGEAVPEDRRLESISYQGQYDPHIWFEVPLWWLAAERVKEALSEYAPEQAPVFEENFLALSRRLEDLHAEVRRRAGELPPEQRVIVTAHDAFRYFGRAYGFEVHGLQGLSTQTEPSAADVKRIADLITERRIKAVFIESSVPERNIRAVQDAVRARGWDVAIGGELFSDAMGDAGTEEGTYIGMIRHNVNTIVEALK